MSNIKNDLYKGYNLGLNKNFPYEQNYYYSQFDTDDLPDELLEMFTVQFYYNIQFLFSIFSKLNLQSLRSVRKTCHRFNLISHQDDIWRDIVISERNNWLQQLHIVQNPFQDIQCFQYQKSEDMNQRRLFGISNEGWRDTFLIYNKLQKNQRTTKDISKQVQKRIGINILSYILKGLMEIMILIWLILTILFYIYSCNKGGYSEIRTSTFQHINNTINNILQNAINHQSQTDINQSNDKSQLNIHILQQKHWVRRFMHSYSLSGIISIIPLIMIAYKRMKNFNFKVSSSIILCSLFRLAIDLNNDQLINIGYIYVFIPLELLTLLGLYVVRKESIEQLEKKSRLINILIVLISIGIQAQIVIFVLKLDEIIQMKWTTAFYPTQICLILAFILVITAGGTSFYWLIFGSVLIIGSVIGLNMWMIWLIAQWFDGSPIFRSYNMITCFIPTSPIVALMILSLTVSAFRAIKMEHRRQRQRYKKETNIILKQIGHENFECLCINLGFEREIQILRELEARFIK